MATILFTWELGMGFGHLHRHSRTIRTLLAAGHQVHFAARDPGNAERAFQSDDISLLQAPVLPHAIGNPIEKTRSFADILHNTGFNDSVALAGRLKAWRQIHDYVKPDLVIYDHSPTAMLALRQTPARHILCGCGFTVPPDVSPLPRLRDWEPVNDNDVAAAEQQVLDTANQALQAINGEPLNALADMLSTDARLLLTFRELDHYGERQDEEYLGITLPENYGAKPHWPAGSGKKIFAYLQPFKMLPEFLKTLSLSRASSIVYAPEVPQRIKTECKSSHIRFVEEAQHIGDVASQCDLAITNGNHGTSTALLLAGKPLLLLPKSLEQLLLSRRVRDLQAGLIAPQLKTTSGENKLAKMLDSQSYTHAAQRFAGRYRDFSPDRQSRRIMEIIHECLDTAHS